MRRLLVVALLALAGCGQEQADLFEVQRSGADPAANVDLVVNDGGTATCNHGKSLALPGRTLLDARELARKLRKQARLSIELPKGPRASLRYVVRTSAGRASFWDTSRNQPPAFGQLQALTRQVTEDVCHIARG
jgi:hypothetical protein